MPEPAVRGVGPLVRCVVHVCEAPVLPEHAAEVVRAPAHRRQKELGRHLRRGLDHPAGDAERAVPGRRLHERVGAKAVGARGRELRVGDARALGEERAKGLVRESRRGGRLEEPSLGDLPREHRARAPVVANDQRALDPHERQRHLHVLVEVQRVDRARHVELEAGRDGARRLRGHRVRGGLDRRGERGAVPRRDGERSRLLSRALGGRRGPRGEHHAARRAHGRGGARAVLERGAREREKPRAVERRRRRPGRVGRHVHLPEVAPGLRRHAAPAARATC